MTGVACSAIGAAGAQRRPILDIHVHLFGTGDNKSGCRLSQKVQHGVEFQSLTQLLRLRERAKTIDLGYERALVEHVDRSGMDRCLILAQDAVYDSNGKPDWDRTHVYTPNDHLLDVVSRNGKMVSCVSINPDRGDAIDELERCASKGARVLKIHPPIQGVNVADKKHAKFFERCTKLKMLVLVHTGHEHAGPVIDIKLADPGKLELALDCGCTVVACHSGTGWATDKPDYLTPFLAMIRKHPKLYGDTSVCGTATRVRAFTQLLADKKAQTRLLHGSDFPFPSAPVAFAQSIGWKTAVRLQQQRNLIKRDFTLKSTLGIGLESATRAHELVDRFAKISQAPKKK